MAKNTNTDMPKTVIEAEGGEIVIQNDAGDTAIIPKNKRQQALKMLENKDYADIDELVSDLPYKEDYAEEGTLIPEGLGNGKRIPSTPSAETASLEALEQTPVTTPTIDESLLQRTTIDSPNLEDIQSSIKEFGEGPVDIPSGYDITGEGFESQLTNWRTQGEEFENTNAGLPPEEQKGFPQNIPYPGEHGCLGAACRVPEPGGKSSYYDIRQKAGIQGVYTGDDEKDSPYRQIDSWELAGVAEATGIGKNWMQPEKSVEEFMANDKDFGDADFDIHMQKIRKKAANNFGDVPIGSLLTTGNAEGVYTDKGEKTMLKVQGKKEPIEIKQKVKPRHTIRYMGKDKDTGDLLFYNYGRLDKVKTDNSLEESDYSSVGGTFKNLEDYMNARDVMYVTSLKDQGDVSANKLEQMRKHNRAIESQSK